jgi:tetratricopeptide (TPR) repeat protein
VPATVEAIVEEAQQVVRRLVAEFPNDPEALHQMGLACVYFGQSGKAIEYWKKCVELNPGYPYVYRDLATVAKKKGNQQEAVRLLRKAMAIDPRSFDNQLDFGDALLAAGQAEEAIAILQRHVQMYPRSVGGHVFLGAAYLQTSALKEAKQAYETAIKLDPLEDLAYSGLATTCARLGDQQQSKHYREKLEQLHKRDRGDQMDRRRDFDDLAVGRGTISKVSTHAGWVYYTRRNIREAERLWLRAAAVTPKHVESRQALVGLYRESGRTADALRMLEELARIVPADAVYPLEAGRLSAALGQTDKAEVWLAQACERDPKAAAGRAALAELYLKTGRKTTEAVTLARKAVELEPTAAYYWLLATACRRSGDLPAALAALDSAIKIDPGNLQYHEAYRSLQEKK